MTGEKRCVLDVDCFDHYIFHASDAVDLEVNCSAFIQLAQLSEQRRQLIAEVLKGIMVLLLLRVCINCGISSPSLFG